MSASAITSSGRPLLEEVIAFGRGFAVIGFRRMGLKTWLQKGNPLKSNKEAL